MDFRGIIVALITIGILVTVHELGHFMVAKMMGMRVDEFAIGFGPVLWKKQKGETLYAIRAIPLGGFNRIAGMNPDDPWTEDSYKAKSVWARMFTIVAGALMNFVLAAVVFAIIYFFWRNTGFFASVWGGILHMVKVTVWMLQGFWTMIFGKGAVDLAGPLGVVMVAGDVAAHGMRAVLNFIAFLSVNLGIINLLPLPALDGGHFVLLLLEAFRGKPLPDKAMEYIQYVGVALILAIVLFSTYQDILRF
ncbi:MAG: site-2 protease family protein [Phascolarctobacterium sp.]|nr:site-2 protease family protein [Phascolarctobacterium sp.]